MLFKDNILSQTESVKRTLAEEGQEVVLEQVVWVVPRKEAGIRQIEQVVDEEAEIALHRYNF